MYWLKLDSSQFGFQFFLACPLVICTGAKRLGKPARKAKSTKLQSANRQQATSNKQNLLPALMHQLNFLIIFAMAFCSCSCQLHAALFAQLPGRAIFSSHSYESSRVEWSIFESRHLPSPTRRGGCGSGVCLLICFHYWISFNKKWSQLS